MRDNHLMDDNIRNQIYRVTEIDRKCRANQSFGVQVRSGAQTL